MLLLGGGEFQGGRDGVERALRDAGILGHLEERVPLGAQPGELGHFFAAQPGRAPAGRVGEAHVGGAQPGAAAHEEGAKLAPALGVVFGVEDGGFRTGRYPGGCYPHDR